MIVARVDRKNSAPLVMQEAVLKINLRHNFYHLLFFSFICYRGAEETHKDNPKMHIYCITSGNYHLSAG